MDDPIQEHRRELAEHGIEKTPEEVAEWFDDVTDLFRAADLEVSPERIVGNIIPIAKAAIGRQT